MATKPTAEEGQETKITAFDSEDALTALTDLFRNYQRQVLYAFAGLAVLAGGYWFYQRSRAMKEERGERAYYEALRAASAGNAALAQADLKKAVQRFEGTTAGAQAALTLAQLQYDEGKYQDGLNTLNSARSSLSSSAFYGGAYHALVAAGYEQLKRYDQAADEYLKAAKATRFDAEKASYKASAARAYMAGGKGSKAEPIWVELAKDPSNPLSGEAKVRLGEIRAKAAS
jgi:predicted negative regulator of RcsB-dependent stress response